MTDSLRAAVVVVTYLRGKEGRKSIVDPVSHMEIEQVCGSDVIEEREKERKRERERERERERYEMR